jgi:tape measure domain-containing protein
MAKHKDDEKTKNYIRSTSKEVQSHLAAERASNRHAKALENLNRQKKISNLGRVAMAGALTSGLGMGGRYAGAARAGAGAGLAMGRGLAGTAGLAVGMMGTSAAIQGVKKSVAAYADLESQTVKLKTLFGDGVALPMIHEFKELARVTPLTTKGLIDSAVIWKSYGNTTDGITERMRRLGDISGGNAEKMKLLTIAVAQVNAQGKLMGQEKNQLINAGMNLSEVAKAAGIEMENFADAMKAGKISAEHLNTAIENMTNEGGSHYGFMADQAETLLGKTEIMKNTFEEMFQQFGRAADNTGMFDLFLDPMTGFAGLLRDISGYIADIGEGIAVIKDEQGKQIIDPAAKSVLDLDKNIQSSDEYRGSSLFGSVENPYHNAKNADAMKAQAEANRKYGTMGNVYATAESERKAAAKDKALQAALRSAEAQKRREADEKAARGTLADAEGAALGRMNEQQDLRRRQNAVSGYVKQGYSVQNAQAMVNADEQMKKNKVDILNAGQLADGSMVDEDRSRKLFENEDKVHRQEQSRIKRRQARENQIEKLQQDELKRKEDLKAKEKKAKDTLDENMDKLDKNYERMKAVAEGPSLKGQNAFKGGSVEEFKFISAMKSESEKQDKLQKLEEIRQKAAEILQEKHEKFLQDLHDDAKQKQEDIAGKIEELKTAIAMREA